ncbi:hypothetical protein [Helicobacter sp. 11S02596-1]|uniref:DUF4376 domain-containing protein n=1 Tax=Helicobacter sp. 11S02596-1 TaxID=1476194 RepID=UPI000BA61E2A|nr:hypothetical protein [Helicobacter sp. 11S02596-1]
MKIYALPLEKINDVEGVFDTITQEDNLVYIQSETPLKEPFFESDLPKGYLEAQAQKLQEAKDRAIEAMNARCDEELKQFTSEALGSPHRYDMNAEDQLNLLGLMIAGVDSFFRCAPIVDGEAGEKSNIPHTKEQIQKLYTDALTYKSSQIYQCGIVKEKIKACESIEAVEALKWEDGVVPPEQPANNQTPKAGE